MKFIKYENNEVFYGSLPEQERYFTNMFVECRHQFFNFNQLLDKNRRIFYRLRNISGVPLNKYTGKKQYSIFSWIAKRYDTLTAVFFDSRISKVDFCGVTKHNLAFSGLYVDKFVIANISIEDFLTVFPFGLPQTQKQFNKWLAYTGFQAKRYFVSEAKELIYADDVTRSFLQQFERSLEVLLRSNKRSFVERIYTQKVRELSK